MLTGGIGNKNKSILLKIMEIQSSQVKIQPRLHLHYTTKYFNSIIYDNKYFVQNKTRTKLIIILILYKMLKFKYYFTIVTCMSNFTLFFLI